MNTRKFTLLLTALAGLAASAFAQTTATEASVARVTGAATVTLPDGSTTSLTVGMKVAQGSTITTGADGDVYLESHAGYVTSIKHDSVVEVNDISVTTEGGQVKEERTMLDLKSGNLVAKLDPRKKAVNNYQVRTPKGVAAARGTVFTIAYKGGTYSIAVVNGTVTVLPTSGSLNFGIQVGPGQSVRSAVAVGSGPAVISSDIKELANENSGSGDDRRELLAIAVATVTIAAQNGIGGTTAKDAADVAKAVFSAVPGAAEQAGAIIKQSNAAKPPADAAAAAAVLQTVTEATPAAAQAALTSGATTGTFTRNTTTTTTSARPPTESNQVTTPQPIDPSTISRSNE